MAQMTMRGVGVDQSDVSAEPGVALYSDSAYRGTLVSAANLLFDLERVEVLRGPQGTLFGRNSTGGALNVITRLPGEEAAMEANFIYGSYDRAWVEVSGDVPIVPGTLTVRGAVARDARDDYADNNFTGREEDDASATFAKIAAVFSPSDELSIVVRGEYNESEIGGPPFIRTDDHPVPPLFTSSANPGGVLSIPGATDKLDWILGGYHYESDIFAHFNFTLPALQATYEALFGLLGGGGPLPPGTLAFFGPRIDGSLDPVPFLEFLGDGETKSNAVFAQGTLELTEGLRGTAGMRWTEDKKQLQPVGAPG